MEQKDNKKKKLLIAAALIAAKKEKNLKRMIRWQALMACILVIAVSVNVICLNIEYSLINKTMTGSKGLSNETAAESKELVEELTNEGVVLLKNDSNSLPVS